MSGKDKGKARADVKISEWTTERVVDWLDSEGFEHNISDTFKRHEVTGGNLPALDMITLRDFGIESYLTRQQIMSAIENLLRLEVAAAKALYEQLWNVHLDTLLDAILDNSGKNIKYLSAKRVIELQLHSMDYTEDVLLIRQEYDDAFVALDSRSSSRGRGGGVVVVGQPGIGKSCFLFYLLLLRLSRGLPTALQTSNEFVSLFTAAGAEVLPITDSKFGRLPPGTWALTDSNEAVGQPCSMFLRACGPAVWVVQVTSPKKSRWREWSKQRKASRYVMDCFPPNELFALGKILDLNSENLLHHYDTWGPSARTCINLERHLTTTNILNDEATSAAAKFTSDPHNILASVTELDGSEVSHVIFALHPKSHRSRDVLIAEIASKHVEGYVIRAAAHLDLIKQSEFFRLISTHPWFKGAAGNVFEKFVHARLIADPSSQPLIGLPANSELPRLNIPVCKCIPLGGLSLLKKANQHAVPFYWLPTNQSFISVDSIISAQEQCILIQATVSKTHDVKSEGVKSIRDHLPKGFSKNRQWALVFITDTDEKAAVLRSQQLDDLPKNVNVYTCTYKIGQFAFTSEELKVLDELTTMDEVLETEEQHTKEESVAEGSHPGPSLSSRVEDKGNEGDTTGTRMKRKRSPDTSSKRHNMPRTAKNKQKERSEDEDDE